jgi:predicted SprT family Zn-dependent metalloprotease
MRLSVSYHEHYGPEELRNTILHEMIHLWLYEQKLPSGHTPLFRQKLEEVGLGGRVRALPVPPRPYKYLYSCPTCRRELRTRRKINSSCGHCDTVYNPRHKFKLVRLLEEEQGAA